MKNDFIPALCGLIVGIGITFGLMIETPKATSTPDGAITFSKVPTITQIQLLLVEAGTLDPADVDGKMSDYSPKTMKAWREAMQDIYWQETIEAGKHYQQKPLELIIKEKAK